MKIAIIACPNGLGHLRRVIAIAEFLYRGGFKGSIDLYAPPKLIEHLNRVWIEATNFTGRPRVKIKWLKDLTIERDGIIGVDERIFGEIDFLTYDLVWSDNLLGVLKQRADAKITGSFFWHEMLEERYSHDESKSLWVEKNRELLKNTNPKIAGVQYFSSPEVRRQKNFFPVGLYRYFGLIGKKGAGGVLLSCGLAGEEEENVKQALNQIIQKKLKPIDYLYVEPRLLPREVPEWIKPADFSGDMFQKISAACIRPGLGTISDALISHSRVFSFCDSNSSEMTLNSSILERMGLGEKYDSALDAYLSAINYTKDQKAINEHIIRTLHLRTDGVMATAEFILN